MVRLLLLVGWLDFEPARLDSWPAASGETLG
jgi:hypothetical protein